MDALSAVVVGAVAVLGFSHHLEITYLYVLSAFFGATFSFYTPALSAIMPELIPADVLVQGNALRGLGRQTAAVIGPLAGGVIVSTQGPPAAFALDAATFAFSFAVFYFSNPPRREHPSGRNLVHEIREGFAYTFSVSWIWIAIIGFAATNGFFFAGFTVALPILVLNVLKGNAAIYGLIGAAQGLGEIAGGFLVGNLHFKKLIVGTYVFSALLGLSFAVLGIAPVLAVVLLGGFLFSFCIVASNTHWDSSLQTFVPRHLLGRVTSIDFFGSYLVGPIAPLLAAEAIARVGPSMIFVIGGLVTFAYWAVATAITRPDRNSPLTATAGANKVDS
jgi:MFS family permease